MTARVHVPGEFVAGLGQLCSRCGYVLMDGQQASVPDDRGWSVGERVVVQEGNPRFTAVESVLDPERDRTGEVECEATQ